MWLVNGAVLGRQPHYVSLPAAPESPSTTFPYLKPAYIPILFHAVISTHTCLILTFETLQHYREWRRSIRYGPCLQDNVTANGEQRCRPFYSRAWHQAQDRACRQRHIDMSSFSSQLHQISDDPSSADSHRNNRHEVLRSPLPSKSQAHPSTGLFRPRPQSGNGAVGTKRQSEPLYTIKAFALDSISRDDGAGRATPAPTESSKPPATHKPGAWTCSSTTGPGPPQAVITFTKRLGP